jgi:hypothetical protein
MPQKTPHRNPKIEQHEPYKITGGEPAPLAAPAILLLSKSWLLVMFYNQIKQY